MKKSLISTITAVIAALILLQTLFFKFTAHPDSVLLFTTLGLEPFGRIGIGVAELIAAILLIVPKTRGIGAVLSIGLMFGAIFSHLTKLGIVFNNDGGALFTLAVITLVASLITAWLTRDRIPVLNKVPFLQLTS